MADLETKLKAEMLKIQDTLEKYRKVFEYEGNTSAKVYKKITGLLKKNKKADDSQFINELRAVKLKKVEEIKAQSANIKILITDIKVQLQDVPS
jgi:hypothetical protein